jgi:hypothetical protein
MKHLIIIAIFFRAHSQGEGPIVDATLSVPTSGEEPALYTQCWGASTKGVRYSNRYSYYVMHGQMPPNQLSCLWSCCNNCQPVAEFYNQFVWTTKDQNQSYHFSPLTLLKVLNCKKGFVTSLLK